MGRRPRDEWPEHPPMCAGRQQGLSLRTVRRRISDLMIDLGADTRVQAGAEAVRRGWL